MEYEALVKERKSIRDFKDKEVTDEQIREIQEYFSHSRRLMRGIGMELKQVNRDYKEALEGLVGYKGNIIGAPYYLLLLSETGEHYLENAGYVCEDIILKLTDMELDSCWVTVDDGEAVKQVLGVDSNQKAMALIAYGYGKEEHRRITLNIKNESNVDITIHDGHIAPKMSVGDMVYYEKWGQEAELDDTTADDGLIRAFASASLAPTFLNRQPFRFILDLGMVALVAERDALTDEFNGKLNLGVVMLHFAAVLSDWRPKDTEWIFGAPDQDYGLPENCQVIAYCKI